MPHRIVFRPAALRDLDSLYDFIRDNRGSPTVAIGYIRRIRTFCENLATFPERGARRDDLYPGLRVTSFERRIAIAYVPSPDLIRIGRIFYAGRDYEVLIAEEPDAFR